MEVGPVLPAAEDATPVRLDGLVAIVDPRPIASDVAKEAGPIVNERTQSATEGHAWIIRGQTSRFRGPAHRPRARSSAAIPRPDPCAVGRAAGAGPRREPRERPRG